MCGSLAMAFVCVVNPVSLGALYDAKPAAPRLQCRAWRMALSGSGLDSMGKKQQVKQVIFALISCFRLVVFLGSFTITCQMVSFIPGSLGLRDIPFCIYSSRTYLPTPVSWAVQFSFTCWIDSPLSAKVTPSGGGLATTASLERVMDGLGESEKYNAVLQGVSSIVMNKNGRSAGTDAFGEVFQLLDEMHANRIKCTIRTASAVVDAATATANVGIISEGEDFEFVVTGNLP